jgi:hypothetical protein
MVQAKLNRLLASKAIASNEIKISYVFFIFLPILFVISSISRFPYLDEIKECRLLVFLALFLAVILIFFIVSWNRISKKYLLFTLGLVVFKLVYGIFVGNLLYEQPINNCIQEARYGLALIFLPIVSAFISFVPTKSLLKFVILTTGLIALLDCSIFYVFSGEPVLELGNRTDSRYLCSVLIPLFILACIFVRNLIYSDPLNLPLVLFLSMLMIFHSYFITTSRLESILSITFFFWLLITKWQSLRYLSYVLYSAFFLFILFSLPENLDFMSGEIAGRNFSFAFNVAYDALPFGFGFINDYSLDQIFNVPTNFYFSDYGLFLYVFRYGFIGLLIFIFLLGYWFRFFEKTRKYIGIFAFQMAILIYLFLVPVIDYIGLNGVFMLVTMHYLTKNIRKSL